jgi:hypothetical protein
MHLLEELERGNLLALLADDGRGRGRAAVLRLLRAGGVIRRPVLKLLCVPTTDSPGNTRAGQSICARDGHQLGWVVGWLSGRYVG